MKKIISVFLCTLFLLSLIVTANATTLQEPSDIQIIATDDGGYVMIEVYNGSTVTRGTVSKAKSYTRYNSNNVALWKATVTGSFTYDGRYATCTSSSCSVTIYDNSWYTISKSAWTDENYAKGTVTMGEKLLGVTVSRETYTISLLCDRYGNVS